MSSIGSFNYGLAKHLVELLSDIIPSEHCAKDTFSFVEELKEVSMLNSFMVSFDVNSLFTNIPLNETIDIAVTIILDKKPNLGISQNDLKQLFLFATSFFILMESTMIK